MHGTRNGNGAVADDGRGAPLDVLSRGHDHERPRQVALPRESLRRLRRSWKRLRKGCHEVLSPQCCSVTPCVDATPYVALAWRMARRYHRNARRRGIDLDDLFGEACLALARAAEGFDAGRGATFRHYAWTAMCHALARAVRRHRPYCPLSRAKGKLMELHARSTPDPDTVADVQTLLSGLGPIEKDLVEKWFGLGGGEVWSLKQLAAGYKITPNKVRPMLERALATLRRCAGSPAVGSGQAHPNCPLPRPPTWS